MLLNCSPRWISTLIRQHFDPTLGVSQELGRWIAENYDYLVWASGSRTETVSDGKRSFLRETIGWGPYLSVNEEAKTKAIPIDQYTGCSVAGR